MDTLFTLSKDILDASGASDEYRCGETLLSLWRKIVKSVGGSVSDRDNLFDLYKKYAKALGVVVMAVETRTTLLRKILNALGGQWTTSDNEFTLLRKLGEVADIFLLTESDEIILTEAGVPLVTE